MTVLDVMAKSPALCLPTTPLEDVARMMLDHDCGAIPVVEDLNAPRPVGVITDRDIVIRVLAKGQCPLEATAEDAMSDGVATASSDMSLDAVALIMEQNQVRRIPVVDAEGKIIGVVSQADLALNASPDKVGEVLKRVSDEEVSDEEKAPMGGAYSG